MADRELGTIYGFQVVTTGTPLLATVTADGSNTFDVSAADFRRLEIGMVIDITHKTTGVVLASARSITVLDSANTRVTYSGADVTTTTSHGVYLTGQYANNRSNSNTGASPASSFDYNPLDTVQAMRDRLISIDSGFYTAAHLNSMTYNDMVYAIRVSDFPSTIKQ